MAILGLRALYFALAAMIHRFHYLKYALATFLIFIGAKIFVADFLLAGGKFPTWVSLGVTLVLIAVGVGYSLWKTRGAPEPDWPAGRRPDKPAGIHSLDKGLQDGTLLGPWHGRPSMGEIGGMLDQRFADRDARRPCCFQHRGCVSQQRAKLILHQPFEIRGRNAARPFRCFRTP